MLLYQVVGIRACMSTPHAQAKEETEENQDQSAADHRRFQGQGRDIEDRSNHVSRDLRNGEGAEGKGGELQWVPETGGIAAPGVAVKLRVGEKHYRRRVESLYELQEVVRQKLGISRGAVVAGEREMGAGACGRFELTYVDCDDDVITVGSEAEFQEAAHLMRGEALKLTVMMSEDML